MRRTLFLTTVLVAAAVAASCGGSSSAAGRSTTTSSTVAAVGGPVDAARPAGPDATSSTTTTTTVPGNASGACPVGRWRQDGPPSGFPGTIQSGGTGMVIVVDADGNVTQDFAEYEPVVATSATAPDARVTYAPTGVIRARVDLGTSDSEWAVTGTDASGLGGTGQMEMDGQVIPIDDLGQIASSLGGMDGARIGCGGNETLKVTAGPLTYSFFRA